MARIPEEEIERVKRETDLAALARSRGIELNKHGSNGHLVGKCPFHDDKEPSFIVTPAKGLFHCMGCGVAGNAIQFVEKFDGVSFRHAFELLAEGGAAVFTAPAIHPIKQSTVPRLDNPLDPEAPEPELLKQVVDYYHERLLSPAGKDAIDFLKSRGIFSEEAIRTFKIGFSDRSLGLRLPDANRKQGSLIRTKLQKIGIIRETGHEHFSGSIVLPVFVPTPAGDAELRRGEPVFDTEGSVAEIYGRKICNRLRKGTPLHLYLPGPHAGIWNPDALAAPEIILCEAPIDALTFYVNNIRNVTFIYGTEAFPDYMFKAFIEHRIKRVYLAYDADEAGERAAKRDVERFTAHGIEVFRIKFPRGMDVNEYAQKVTPAAKSLRVAIDSAEWLGLHSSTCLAKRSTRSEESDVGIGHTHACHAEASSRRRAPADSNNKIAANLLAASPQGESRRSLDGTKTDAANQKSDYSESLSSLPSENSVVHPSLTRQGPSTLLRTGDYHVMQLASRQYRVGGLDKNNSLEVLKVTVRLMVEGPGGDPAFHLDGPDTEAGMIRFHLDHFDMTRDGERRRFIERASEETGLEKELVKRDLGRLLLALEEEQSRRLNAAVESSGVAQNEMSPEEREEALTFLKAPDLIDRICRVFPACGLAGEGKNLLGAYLACTSRKLDKPLAVIIQSTSAAGKSTLMDAVLSMFPEEERIKYSAMTGQSLFYLGETDLRHRILAIVEEEGAEKASYALKLLQSEGELTIASTGKDPHTGRMETQEYHVEGPVMIFLTTTAVEIDEELQNRCLMLSVDESREQTERIHALQRRARTFEGLIGREKKKDVLRIMKNAQRLLEPVSVVNDFAERLTFVNERTRTRRDHEKYLSLIDAIALLHQHQRQIEISRTSPAVDGIRFIRATLEDIELANRLAPELLGRSLDELSPQTRRLLSEIKTLVGSMRKALQTDQRTTLFTRRDVRECCGWSEYQARVHLTKLEELEYVQRRWGQQGKRCAYELLIDADEPDALNHIGLIDARKLGKDMGTTPTSCMETGTSSDFVETAPRSGTASISAACN